MSKVEEVSLKPKTISDPEAAHDKKPRNNRCCCCLITTAIILLSLIVLSIILAFTVFKVKDPTTTLVSTKVTGVSPRVDLPTLKVEMNITLDLKLSVHNPNRYSFKHGTGQSLVYYQNDQVAVADITAGNIGEKKSSGIDATVIVEADKFTSNTRGLISDVAAGTMRFDVYTRLPGRVTLLGFIKRHVVATSTCHLDIQISNLTVTSQVCKNKAKL
ncbi:hypothetical protein IFM89_038432 [Coptis chinensis]|uniref:Late embryogenesis abundant protein LEA-2 subgroup domain-containing protein n=1 Tax=Coptis chinensis TaxID=261450 RepID=A0A835LK02_9MAGN|nr:hypothetical protein IFM89_038432 [Coptis chinensis]